MSPARRKLSLAIFLAFAFVKEAFAYVDPGTGSAILQGLIGLAAALIYYFRNPKEIWKWIKSKISRGKT